MKVEIRNCAALDLLKSLPDCTVDSLVTDPPSGIGFMGKDWDRHSDYEPQTHKGRDALKFGAALGLKGWEVGFVAFLSDILSHCQRTLKPGGHGLVWALPRTSDLTGLALRLAGFEIRDTIHHVFGSGFPKSLDVGKAIDNAAGAEREVVGHDAHKAKQQTGSNGTSTFGDFRGNPGNITAPATPEAKRWDGWGTALKPSHEVWWLVRKPLAGTVAESVLSNGTGALNVDGCRVGVSGGTVGANYPKTGLFGMGGNADIQSLDKGRWPPNMVLTHAAECGPGGCVDGCPVEDLGAQSGATTSQRSIRVKAGAQFGNGRTHGIAMAHRDNVGGFEDSGTAARFFPIFRYISKPSRGEREAGCAHLPAKSGAEATARKAGSAGLSNPRAGAGRTAAQVRNFHPTVKPIELMRWLVRLVTPPGGLVLDPFTGSGTTAVACVHERVRFIGSEINPDYHKIATARVDYADPAGALERRQNAPEPSEPPADKAGQTTLF